MLFATEILVFSIALASSRSNWIYKVLDIFSYLNEPIFILWMKDTLAVTVSTRYLFGISNWKYNVSKHNVKKGTPFYRLLWSCVVSFVCIIYVRIMFVRRILVCAFSFFRILFGLVCNETKNKERTIFGTSF